jgi:predicted NBD/HSP70 family sugar kinase
MSASQPQTEHPPEVRMSLREYNQARVTEALRAAGSATRAELRALTGLSRATLGTLLDRLVAEGTVSEVDTEPAHAAVADGEAKARGRPARRIKLTSRAGLVIGIAFGHSDLWAASADLSGTVLREHREQLPVDNSAKAALDTAADVVGDLLVSSALGTTTVAQIVVGLPCPINSKTERIVTNNILPGWVNVQPTNEMERRTGHRVVIENDANLAALGEWRYGAGQGVSDLIYVKASVGIGAGLVLGGRLYRGATGTAGEFGHTQVNPDGNTCRCGNRGCLETIASLRQVLNALSEAHGRQLNADELLTLITDNDIAARRVVADAGRRIGRPLADLCNVLNPGVVVVGGELGNAGTVLTDAVQESINRYAQPMVGEAITAEPSSLGPRAEMLGAVAAAITNARRRPQPAL